MRKAWLFFLGLASVSGYTLPLFLEQEEPLRFLRATELLSIRLEALALDPSEEQAEKILGDLALFAGSLEVQDPDLLAALEGALEGLEEATKAKDAARLAALSRQTQGLLERVRARLVPQMGPALEAALMAQLLLLDDGVAESYEDAAGGEEGAYGVGRVALERVRARWQSLKLTLAGQAEGVARVEEGLRVLERLFSSPTAPARFQDPEDAEQAALDIVFALAAASGADLLPRDLGEVLAKVEGLVAQACGEGSRRLALERLLSAHLLYRAYLEDPLKTLAPGLGEELDGLLAGLARKLRGPAGAGTASDCEAVRNALVQAGHTLR
ncbi:hypothetical protein Thermus77359_22790 [Thermus oshimai]|jgi:hypothetical protein